jgi:hypothetical protein
METLKLMEEMNILEFILIAGVVIIGILIIRFLISSGKKSKKDAPHALGLPQGSVRAILALTLIILFIFIALFFYMESSDPEAKKEMAKNILTIMGTLVIAVSSFYFGIKATEQGNKMAHETFRELSQNKNYFDDKNIHAAIIQESITNNKEHWKKKYNCEDIKLGKKMVGQTQFELNCLVFIVKIKINQTDNHKEIPSFINYNSKGKAYLIPTDIREIISSNKVNIPFEKLSENEQYSIIDEYIELHVDDFLDEFPATTGVYAGNKKIEGKEIGIISLVIQVKNKLKFEDSPIPAYINFKSYGIPTDIEETEETLLNLSDSVLNAGVSRIMDEDFGSLGLPVIYKKELHVLSCFHVFFNEEMKKGVSSVSYHMPIENDEIISPSLKHSTEIKHKIGKVVSGKITRYLDVAVMKPNSEFLKSLENEELCKEYRTLARIHQNKIYLRFWGKGSNKKIEAKLLNISVVQPITYNGIGKINLRGLIQLEKCALGGDSGAAVYDLSGTAVGIIVGSDSKYTYAISAYNIFNKSEFKLI